MNVYHHVVMFSIKEGNISYGNVKHYAGIRVGGFFF